MFFRFGSQPAQSYVAQLTKGHIDGGQECKRQEQQKTKREFDLHRGG
jgi:hypothetical protein